MKILQKFQTKQNFEVLTHPLFYFNFLSCSFLDFVVRSLYKQKMENHPRFFQDSIEFRQIQELTQQDRTQDKIKISIVTTKTSQTDDHQLGLMQRSLGCIKGLLGYCFRQQKNEYDNFEDIEDEEITKQIAKIRKKKVRTGNYLPPIKNPNFKTLVLDLDETLISTSFRKPKQYDFSICLPIYGQTEKLYVTKRFGLDIFLYEMSQIYEIVIFAAGEKSYVNRVLEIIDTKKRISHVLTRQHCTIFKNTYYIKNLELLGRPLKQTLLIDDNSNAGILQSRNFYKVEPFYGDRRDRRLLRLIEFLKAMSQEQTFDGLLQKRRQFESWQTGWNQTTKKQRHSELYWVMAQQESQQTACQLQRQKNLEVILQTNQ